MKLWLCLYVGPNVNFHILAASSPEEARSKFYALHPDLPRDDDSPRVDLIDDVDGYSVTLIPK